MGASQPSRVNGPISLYICIYICDYIFVYIYVTRTVHTVMSYVSSNFVCAQNTVMPYVSSHFICAFHISVAQLGHSRSPKMLSISTSVVVLD